MAEKEYIERDRIVKFIENGLNDPDKTKAFGHDAVEILAEIHLAPAADVAPVVHGEWMPTPDGINPVKCRRCGTVAPYRMESNSNHDIGLYPYKSNYCPHCGAKMDGGKHGQA
jgi:hypothetical protein